MDGGSSEKLPEMEKVRQLDLRQFPVEIEDALELIYNPGYKAPDAVEHAAEHILNAVQNSGDRVVDCVEGCGDAGLHGIHHAHDHALDAVPNGGENRMDCIENRAGNRLDGIPCRCNKGLNRADH